jgi:hypothetical protein
MLDTDTFVTTVYVIVDDFCNEHLREQVQPGPTASLCASEVITLALIGQWSRFASERDFYGFADQRLRWAFPGLPSRTQYNRLARKYHDAIARLAMHLADELILPSECFEDIDCSAIVVRNARRRGTSWLLGDADIGRSTRLGWFYGFRLLLAVTRSGAITGYCFAPASQNDRHLAEAFFALRDDPSSPLSSIGRTVSGVYLADKGFAGKRWLPQWLQRYGATVIAQGQTQRWPTQVCHWLAHHRQIVETVFGKLQQAFGLLRERPHRLDGLQMRLAAKVALHNLCMLINRSLGRPLLAMADLFGWA